MSHCVTLTGWERERAKDHGREGRRRTGREKEPDQHFPEARARERRETGGPGRGNKTHTHTHTRLIASLSFHLSLYLPTLWPGLKQQDGSVRNNCCFIGKLCLSLCVSAVNKAQSFLTDRARLLTTQHLIFLKGKMAVYLLYICLYMHRYTHLKDYWEHHTNVCV